MQRAGGCGGQCEGLLASAVGRKVMSLYLAVLKLLEIGCLDISGIQKLAKMGRCLQDVHLVFPSYVPKYDGNGEEMFYPAAGEESCGGGLLAKLAHLHFEHACCCLPSESLFVSSFVCLHYK